MLGKKADRDLRWDYTSILPSLCQDSSTTPATAGSLAVTTRAVTAGVAQGRIDQAIHNLETAVNRGVPPGTQVRGQLGYAYARASRRDEVEQFAAALLAGNPRVKALRKKVGLPE